MERNGTLKHKDRRGAVNGMSQLKERVRDQLRRRRAFMCSSSWKISRRGNLWREWDDLIVSVFERSDLLLGWSIANSEEGQFSRDGFESEEEAKTALFEELER